MSKNKAKEKATHKNDDFNEDPLSDESNKNI